MTNVCLYVNAFILHITFRLFLTLASHHLHPMLKIEQPLYKGFDRVLEETRNTLRNIDTKNSGKRHEPDNVYSVDSSPIFI